MIKSLSFLFLILFCAFSFGQNNYSGAAKRAFKSGIKSYDEGNTDQAITEFTEAINEDGQFAEAYLNRSIAFLKLTNYEKAFADAKEAYKINPVQGAIQNQLGKCYYNLGNIDSAIYFLKAGMETGSKSDEDLYYLANIQVEMSEYNEAIETYNELLERHPENSAILNQRGVAYFEIGEYSKAEEDFLKALEHEPNNISIYSNLANAAIEAKDQERAIDYINRGLAKAEGHVKMEFLILKGNYYFVNGDYEKANASYNEAFALENDNPIVLTNQASCLIQMGDYESAIVKCTEAIDANPEFMQAYFNRGIAYEMIKNTSQACLDWEEAFILGSATAEEYLNGPACSE